MNNSLLIDNHVQNILNHIIALKKKLGHVTVAIDGNCASGKTTLAQRLASTIDCNLFHTDDFFLPLKSRKLPNVGNQLFPFDCMHFLTDVILNIQNTQGFAYQKFDCKTQSYGEKIIIEYKSINIIEGAYSTSEALKPYYNFSIFVKADLNTQIERISQRNGTEQLNRFTQEWIPCENIFFSKFKTEEYCDMVINTSTHLSFNT